MIGKVLGCLHPTYGYNKNLPFSWTTGSSRSGISARLNPNKSKIKKLGWKINTGKVIVQFERGKINITIPGVLMTMANKYGFLVPRLVDHSLSPTWIYHIVVANKYGVVSILRYLPMEIYIYWYHNLPFLGHFFSKEIE